MVRHVAVLFAFVVALAPPAGAVVVEYATPTAAPEGNAVCSVSAKVSNTGPDTDLRLTLTATSGEASAVIGLRHRSDAVLVSTGFQPGCDIFADTPATAALPLPEGKKVKIVGTMLLHAHPGANCLAAGEAAGNLEATLLGPGELKKVKIRCESSSEEANLRLDLLDQPMPTRANVITRRLEVINFGAAHPATGVQLKRKKTKDAYVVRFACPGTLLRKRAAAGARGPAGAGSFVVLDGDLTCDIGELDLYETAAAEIDVVPRKTGVAKTTYQLTTDERGPLFGKVTKDATPVAAGSSAILSVDVRCKGAAGTVTINPNASGGTTTCTCPDPNTGSDKVTCIEIYGAKTDVTLTANASSGSFDKWSGDCAGTQADCKVTLDPSAQNPDKSAKAKFKK